MQRFLVLVTVLTIACEEKDHCTEYVDYMCECYADDPSYDCDEQRAIYEEATLDQQNECAVELDSQQQQDQDNGTGCESGDTGSV